MTNETDVERDRRHIEEIDKVVRIDPVSANLRENLQRAGFDLEQVLFYEIAEDENAVEWVAFIGPGGKFYEFERSDFDPALKNLKENSLERAAAGISHAPLALDMYRERHHEAA